MDRPRLVSGRPLRAPTTSPWRRPQRAGPAVWRRRFRSLNLTVIGVAIIAGAAATLASAWLNAEATFFGPPAPITVISRGQITVVDGDTIRVGGRLTRLVGFNAPETWEPRCDAERQLGNRATSRLRGLLAKSSVEFASARCACRPGTEGTAQCNYGRACGVLRANGRDVGDILITEGLAVRFVCPGTGCPPTPRPWCMG